jgi:hypothetical protein
MNNLDVCSTSYGKKKGPKSNCQFDSRPPKVKNRFDPVVCRWIATHRWKDLKESYKFVSNLIPIRGPSKELWACKVPRVQTGIISERFFESLGTKSHSNVGVAHKCKEYYMGEGVGFPCVWPVVNLVGLRSPVACINTKGAPENELTNLLVSLMQVQVSN